MLTAWSLQVIPNNFTRKYGGGMSNPIFLKPPDGTEWKVYWTKNDDKICFQEGWKEFASYYSLEYGHLLVFEYKGTCHFDVHIFDMSALEVEYPLHNQITNAEPESVEILNEQSPSKKKRVKSPLSSLKPHKTDVESSPNLQILPQLAQTGGSQSGTAIRKMPIIPSIKREFDDGMSTRGSSQLISPRHGTAGNVKEAEKFTSENPFFMINIRHVYLEKSRPCLPAVFARTYFREKQQNVMIKFGEKFWTVKVLSYPSKGKASFSIGWPLFAEESKLQVGDVCVFELINREDAVLQLHIFRGHN
ncbi:hypothetical protein RIF29_14701 [Crotalaria pallida]|uniref:TF-B3 domain-containing protein n=1 Tax=Crotalaria pallida TaxID=3830 RepID=A0AAN9FC64_CROPI